MQLANITSFPQVTPVTASSATATLPSRKPASTVDTVTTASIPNAAASSTGALIVESAYISTVGGTKYDASVMESDDEYVASVPSLPMATATGESLDSAESNLTARIDALV